jgi:hypothetical protein
VNDNNIFDVNLNDDDDNDAIEDEYYENKRKMDSNDNMTKLKNFMEINR